VAHTVYFAELMPTTVMYYLLVMETRPEC